jgi:hypothetical protein
MSSSSETKIIPGSEIWGPALWSIIHGAFRNIPELIPPTHPTQPKHANTILWRQNLRDLQKIITDMENIIPCDVCRKHYNSYLRDYPLNDMKTVVEFQ